MDKDYFSIKILDKNNNEKAYVKLIGGDFGTSDKLNVLKDLSYEYGDILILYHREKGRLTIDGEIINAKEDYTDGVNDEENLYNTIFEITENGLKALYNEAPVIKGADNIKVRKGSNFDLKQGITATDDLEGTVNDKLIINGSLDTSKLGDYTINYEVTDILGRRTIVERVITVVEIPKLELNTFEFAGEEYIFTGWTENIIKTDLKFKLGFDDINHKIKIYGHVSALMNTKSPYKENKYFEVKLLDKNGAEKISQDFKGEDSPYSPNKISNLYDIPYEYGDILKIYHAEPKKLRVIGNIIDGKEDYSDGINNINNINDIENIGFEITENGLKYIYNNKPEINGVRDITIRQGENFNKLEGISAIDDRDGNITSKINITGEVDTNNIGEYTLNYRVEDSWGRQSRAIAHIKVISKPDLEKNYMNFKGQVVRGIGDGKFKIGFDDIKKELNIYDAIDNTFHEYFSNRTYSTIKILDQYRKEKKSISFIGTDYVNSSKLQELNGYNYEYGDRIKIFHAEPDKLDINGEVIDSRMDYSQRQWFDVNAVEFEITENGLKAIYNEVPIITGVENTTIKIGEVFDSLEGVIVRDDHDKNLIPTVTGNVDINKLGDYELTYVVKDSWSAEKTVKRIITVRSNNNPIIMGVDKVIINIGQPFNVMEGVTASDIEDNDLTNLIKIKGAVNTNLIGTYNLIYTVIDSDGNKVNSTRTVVVKSNDKPVLIGTKNITIKEGDTFDPLFEVEARDTESGDLTESIKIKGTVNTKVKGTYDLFYSVADEDGNEVVATRRVIVRSNNKPIISGVENSIIKIGDKFDKLVGVTASDAEDNDLTNKILVDGDLNIFKPGVYELKYTVVDSDGNRISKRRIIAVKTNDKPVIQGMNNITIKVGDDFEPRVDVRANDTEDGELTENIKINNKVDTSKVGEYEVIYSVTDSDGNNTIGKRLIAVRSNEKPTIEGVEKVTLKVGDSFNAMEGVFATDVEDKDLTEFIKIIGDVDTSVEGTNTLIYSVTDSDKNETIIKRNITVKSNNKPTILGLEDITIKLGDDFDKVANVIAYDEEDGEITHSIQIEGNVDINNIGTYNLVYKIIDSDGNEVSKNRTITVRSNAKPEIKGVDGIVIKVGDNFHPMNGVTAIDNEDGDLTSNINVIGNVNVNVIGIYELNYSVIDNDKNTKVVKRIVRVRSNEKPIITGVEDIEIKLGDSFNPLHKVEVHDFEDGNLIDSINVENKVNIFQIGEYEVIYSVKDLDRNITTTSRKVKVRSNDKPIINGVNRLTIKIGDTFNSMDGVTATDTEDGDISNFINVDNKVDTSKVGVYDVNYSVTDKDGNKTIVKRKVTVKSNDKPQFIGINNITIKVGEIFDSLFGIVAHDTEDGDISNLINVKGNIDNSQVGIYDLIYSITDSDGNETVATRRVNVRSNNKPVILGADDIIIKSGDSFDKLLGVTATDIENGDLTSSIMVKGDMNTNVPGVYNLIYSVIDNDNNKSKVSRQVIVRTNEKPKLNGVENTIIKIGDTFDPMYGINAVDLEDNDITANIVIHGTVDVNTIGIYDLVYSIKDSDNNETILNRKVTVRSNNKPVITGADNISIKVNDSFNPLNGVKAIDTEDNDLTSSIKVNGNVDINTDGKYVITYSVIDTDGNKTTVNRSITVRTNNKPKFLGIKDSTIKLGDKFDKFIGIEAIDDEDGEINHLINVDGDVDTIATGIYNLIYSVTDSDGNLITANRIITVRTNDKPIISGVDNKLVKVGDIFDEREDVIATDTEDGLLTNLININGDVDTSRVGKYVLDYLVDDKDGNRTVKTRVITVRSNDTPIITGAEDITIKVGDIFDDIEGIIVKDTEDGDITDLLNIEGDVDTSKVGNFTLVYSLIDSDGNELKKTRVITVRSNEKPIISGADKLTLKVGDAFDKMQGVFARDDEDGDITNKITVEGDIDTSKISAYSLFYSVIDNDGNKVRLKRRIKVRSNTKPKIDIDDVTIKLGDTLDYKVGLVATDAEDGDLTEIVKITGDIDNTKIGVYDLIYSVEDIDGNITSITRKVTVRTNDIPVLEGVNDITLKLGDNFDSKLGIVVKDTEDGDLINSLIIKGTVDTSNAGKYILEYIAIDSDGNLVNKTREVSVRTNENPVINGAINTKIKVGDFFNKLKGISAIDKEDGDLTNLIKISGDLNTKKAGIYELTYSVKDNDENESVVKRQIRVRSNEQPIIDGVEDITIKVGEIFNIKQGVTVNDKEDGDLTSAIIIEGSVNTSKAGEYKVYYSVTDNDNNSTFVTRTIIVRTDTKPEINGVKDITIKLGDVFYGMAGVTATDEEDGSLTNLIKIEGNVNSNVLGEYDLKYSVEDRDGNTTILPRKVTVRSNNKPEILGLNNITLKIGDSFNPLEGIIAKDSEDLDLTDKIIVEGNVDTSIADVYRLNYSVADSDGNKIILKRIVEVKTNEKPRLLNIEDAIIKAGETFELIAGEIALDNEDGDISDKIKCIGTIDTNKVGTYELIYTVEDSDGNKTFVKRIVTVRSNERPIINGVEDMIIKVGDTFNPMNGVMATDAEDGIINNLLNIEGNVNTNIEGIYQLKYSVIDSDGNKTVIDREVRVRSNEKPVIIGADNMTIKLGYAFDKFISIIAIDKEDGDLTSLVSVTGDLDVNKIGSYNLTYSVTDDDGNITNINRVITVRSNEKPVIIGAKNTTIKLGDNFDANNGVIVTDNEDKDLTDSLTITGSVDTSRLGTYNLTYTVIDSDDNIVKVTRTVTVRSNDKPVISGILDKTIKIGDNFNPILGVLVKDTEDGEITNRIAINGIVDNNNVGEYELTYSVIDDDGNKVSKARKIIVRSNDKPVITGTDNILLKVGDNFNPMEGIKAYDTEDKDITNLIQVKGNVDVNKSGIYQLKYSVIDSDGNKTIINRQVRIRSNEKPVLIGIKDEIIKIGYPFDERAGVIANDKEDGELLNNINIKGKVDINTLGEYELVYSVTDNDGNLTEAIRKVKVRSNEAPKILGIKNTVIKVKENIDLMQGITAIDTEDGELTNSVEIAEILNNNIPGIYEVFYSVTDRDENTTRIKRLIKVESNDIPLILGAENITIKAGENFNPMDGVRVIDTEDGNLTDKTYFEGNFDVNKVGDYELKYYSIDSDGNKVEINRKITVRSNEKPVILNVIDKKIKVNEEFDPKEGIVVSDLEDADIEIQNNLKIKGNLDAKTSGIYKLTYSVTDSDGNETSADREITVETNDKPIITGNKDITIKIGDRFDYFTDIVVLDTEDGDLSSKVEVEGSVNTNKEGVYKLYYGAIDSDGNKTTVPRVITVRSNEKPAILGANNITLKLGDIFNPLEGVIVKDKEDGDITSKINILGNVDINNIGIYSLTYSVIDNDGNKTELKRSVRVRSNEKPIITGISHSTIAVGKPFDIMAGIEAEDTEDGELTELIKVIGEVDTNVVGEYELKYSIRDYDENETIAKRIVTVRSNEKPEIIGADIIVLKVGDNFDARKNIVATDKEDGDLTSLIKISGDVDTNKMGTYDLIYTIKDNDGNVDTVKRRVRVRSNEKPKFVRGIEDITIKAGDNFYPLIYVKAMDREDGDLSKSVKVKGEVNTNAIGTYELIYSVVDYDGNETIAKRIVTVRSNEKPTLIGVDKLVLKVGEVFNPMLNIIATDKEDGDITNLVKVEGEINNLIPDEYKLVYSVADSDGNMVNIPRVIKVKSNTKPTFKGLDDITIKVGDTFDILSGVIAKDEEDGDLTESIEVIGKINANIVGEYELTYLVKDDDNNEIIAKRIVNVRSNEAPIINGVDDITIKVGDTFDSMLNIEVLDVEDGNLTNKLDVLGKVDTNNVGLYKIMYSVVDSDENKTIVKRKVRVRSNEKPEIRGLDNKVIKIGENLDLRLGVEAIDIEDGNLTELISITGVVDNKIQGKYPLIYSIKDSDGNITSLTRTITVKSLDAPIILGIEDTSIKLGEIFDLMAGVTAKTVDGYDISENIEIIGFVDTTKTGTYKVIYLVSDGKGNKIILTRNVIVENPEEPIIGGLEDIIVNKNYDFDPKAGIEITNLKEDQIITSIEVIGTVDTNIEGDYNLLYIFTDNYGKKFSERRIITVTSATALILSGVDDVTLRVGDNFDSRFGVILNNYKGEDLTETLQVKGTVNTNIPGIYRLVYSALDKEGILRSANRDIKIVDKDTPIIHGINDLILNFGDEFDPLLGITAMDIISNDLNENIKVVGKVDTNIPGVYNLVYSVTNRLGKTTTVTRTIKVKNQNGNLIKGVENIILREGDIFDPMAGVSINYKTEEEVTKLIKVIGNVDTNKTGKYKLIYSLTDKNGVKAVVARSILVKNDKESLIQGIDDIEVNLGEEFDPKLGVIAKDKNNNDLTNLVKVEGKVDFTKVGKYKLIYSLIDKEGVKTQIIRNVNVSDINTPKLIGAEDILIKNLEEFNPMEGIIARNNKGVDLTDKIKIKGMVDNKNGSYNLQYSIIDEDGNKLEQNRVITVERDEAVNLNEKIDEEKEHILYDENGKANVQELVPYDKKPKPLNIIGLILMAIGTFIRRKKE
ncbi:immunoglobulin-like domain-containing protein [Clostridium tarantellae]|uniref:immunoglobulin-like domain-containing protein n=1 Tax=Clostridium tarantellae TaxID=39493 RepID=UPI002E0EE2A7